MLCVLCVCLCVLIRFDCCSLKSWAKDIVDIQSGGLQNCVLLHVENSSLTTPGFDEA